jgi:hypothetical protein
MFTFTFMFTFMFMFKFKFKFKFKLKLIKLIIYEIIIENKLDYYEMIISKKNFN